MQFFFKVVFAIIYVKDGKLENGFTNKFSIKKIWFIEYWYQKKKWNVKLNSLVNPFVLWDPIIIWFKA